MKWPNLQQIATFVILLFAKFSNGLQQSELTGVAEEHKILVGKATLLQGPMASVYDLVASFETQNVAL